MGFQSFQYAFIFGILNRLVEQQTPLNGASVSRGKPEFRLCFIIIKSTTWLCCVDKEHIRFCFPQDTRYIIFLCRISQSNYIKMRKVEGIYRFKGKRLFLSQVNIFVNTRWIVKQKSLPHCDETSFFIFVRRMENVNIYTKDLFCLHKRNPLVTPELTKPSLNRKCY